MAEGAGWDNSNRRVGAIEREREEYSGKAAGLPDFQIIFHVPHQLPKFPLTRASGSSRSHRKIIEMKKQLVFVLLGPPLKISGYACFFLLFWQLWLCTFSQLVLKSLLGTFGRSVDSGGGKVIT